ncbi:uncharacterized protein Z519_06445 [Cladophialophora bantiana CBS 173.52]|uniref:Uncharacterized protein n=1 Tax=Cladophialophora bantiana (strain ATCC 10958 / CBS 173.52 / CDC B-1940 / NIH 8579) TaxID=1442370 RepID=A0A0D2HH65_CLAB1|nr:uncharacterized protein Z519_06445 [Cladophialophora bantiana CBS 173.52]KIW92598.1 hypothetical protein Z519_06445 [Cladophialophora bantiana CBS 173.52]
MDGRLQIQQLSTTPHPVAARMGELNVARRLDNCFLQHGTHQPERFGFTFLHEFALHKDDPADNEERAAHEELIRLISAPEVWKTVRSFDDRAITAYELVQQEGNKEAAQILNPTIIHELSGETVVSLERPLHQFIHEETGKYIRKPNFRHPQISILMEMQCPELWVPIPHMYGEFAIDMHGNKLLVTMYETIPGRNQPRRTEKVLGA